MFGNKPTLRGSRSASTPAATGRNGDLERRDPRVHSGELSQICKKKNPVTDGDVSEQAGCLLTAAATPAVLSYGCRPRLLKFL